MNLFYAFQKFCNATKVSFILRVQLCCLQFAGGKLWIEYVGRKVVYRQSKDLVQTSEGSKCIFVLHSSIILYVRQKKKRQFQYSSSLGGGATMHLKGWLPKMGAWMLDICHLFYTYIPLIIFCT